MKLRYVSVPGIVSVVILGLALLVSCNAVANLGSPSERLQTALTSTQAITISNSKLEIEASYLPADSESRDRISLNVADTDSGESLCTNYGGTARDFYLLCDEQVSSSEFGVFVWVVAKGQEEFRYLDKAELVPSGLATIVKLPENWPCDLAVSKYPNVLVQEDFWSDGEQYPEIIPTPMPSMQSW